MKTLRTLALLLAASATLLHGQSYQWSNFVGKSGGPGNVDGTGSAARFSGPRGIAVDASGNVFVADTHNKIIRKITKTGVVTTFAGKRNGIGSVDGTGEAAIFAHPEGLAAGAGGTLYVADGRTVRKITSAGVVSTLAGLAGENGSEDGAGAAARFDQLTAITVAPDGTLYGVEYENCTIRKITPAGVVTTLAGTVGAVGSADGTGSAARFNYPTGICADKNGVLYVADADSNTIRKVTPAGVVTTFAGMAGQVGTTDGTGNGARFDYPIGVTTDNQGNVYVTDNGNGILRKVTPAGVVTTLAGMAGQFGSQDGTGSAARFNDLSGVAVDATGTLFVTDDNNTNVRKITQAGVVTTLAGMAANRGNTNGTGGDARLSSPPGVTVDDSGAIYIMDVGNYQVRKATSAGVVTTHAGAGTSGVVNGPAPEARFGYALDVAADASGNVYVADTYKNIIRKISSGGEVSTFAGTVDGYGSVDGTGAEARFRNPAGVAVGADGTVYVADFADCTIRKITPAGEVTTLAGQPTFYGFADGTGAAARFAQPQDVAVNAGGDVYVADMLNHTIRKITPAGVVTTLAGQAGVAGSADGTGSAARFRSPTGVAVDAGGHILVVDTGNHTIRKITPAGVVTTIGGLAPFATDADGLGSAARFSSPQRIAIAPTGEVYVADRNNNRIMKGVPLPEIGIAQPAQTDLVDGTSSIDFGTVGAGQTIVKTFTLRSDSAASLEGLSLSVTGAHAADFTAAGLSSGTLAAYGETTFTVTFHGDAAGARTAVLHVTSNDSDEGSFDIALKGSTDYRPLVTAAPQPSSRLEGQSVDFQVTASHPHGAVTYQWFKNGAKITGATQSQVELQNLKITDAGTYGVKISYAGQTAEHTTTLVVVRPTNASLVAPVGGKLDLVIPYGGQATFEWTKNGVIIPGATGNKLNLTSLPVTADEVIYLCRMLRPEGGKIQVGSFTVRVFDSKPIVTQNQNMPHGAVGKPYTHQISVSGVLQFAPTAYAATGLPPGVTVNPKTGFISGTPTVAKDYKIIVSASNSKGSHASLESNVTITPLLDTVVGSFSGIVGRHPTLNDNLGGRLDLTITKTAAISGSITLGTKSHPLKGQLVAGVNPLTADITIPRTGHMALHLHLDINPLGQIILSSSSLKSGLSTASVSGWRQVWRTTGAAPLNPATTTPKLFNFGLRAPAMAGVPVGDGYGSFTLAKDGKVIVAGKTCDGENFTCGTFVGPQGQILIFQTLHTPKGSLCGTLDIDPTDTGMLNDDVLEGSVSWSRPANTKSRVSPAGFGPVDLTAFGGRYTPPVAPALVLGLTVNVDKAMITFEDGGLAGASINPNVAAFDILAGNKPSLPASLSLGNPGSVKITKLDAKTGLFTGSFVLNDTELRTGPAFNGKMLSRTASFSGILTTDNMGPVGVGHFLLPEMPHDAMPPLPATTPTTGTMLSGSVTLEKK
ncbi:choice-of-anchor D domain-containing protein [Brevifollis gellanilyticus]|uniref:Ig-like domain-containing protein n=1 Tax=Brevifollis gellanilyticus TaxID=748831 RepID=A0A512M4S6_9BACT|nr:choice-of-anchor D domain-containing protein [Brevifollis gellanilyticus]GEP41736.1 hypothetical protein BGE01nite_10270 [Brevifollis gellanilyticus]